VRLDGATKGALESGALGGALGAVAVTDIRAAPRAALCGVRFDDAGDEDDAPQVGLRRPPAAADAAPLRNAYEVPSPSA
jgi:hypothetical protein